MDILVLGGTQFVGRHFVSECLRRGHQVTLFNRGQSNPGLFPEVCTLYGDRERGDFSSLKGRQWDVVIDVPYFKPPIVKKAIDFLYDKVRCYVFISTIGVHDLGKWPDSWYEIYFQDKVEAERLFHEKMKKTLIFRPGILCGAGDNTNRFDYRKDGIFIKGTKDRATHYSMVEDFVKFSLEHMEKNHKGVYEYEGNMGFESEKKSAF